MMSARPALRGLPLGLAAFAALAVLLALGTWQMQRLGWKTGLIERAERQLAAPAAPLPTVIEDGRALDFRRVAVAGAYLHDRAQGFGLFASGGAPGGRLLAPLRLDDGRVLLVDRGWVPEAAAAARPCRARPGGPAGSSSPVSRAGVGPPGAAGSSRRIGRIDAAGTAGTSRRWRVRPVCRYCRVVLTLEASDGPAGLPRATRERRDYRNPHLGYAITWYGLAAALVAVYVAFSRSPSWGSSP